MKSEIVKAVFQDELERNQRLIARYEKEIANLPKGTIFARKIGNQDYYYLTYRDGKKVVSKFLGKADSFDCDELKAGIEKGNEYKRLLKNLRIEQKELLKVLK